MHELVEIFIPSLHLIVNSKCGIDRADKARNRAGIDLIEINIPKALADQIQKMFELEESKKVRETIESDDRFGSLFHSASDVNSSPSDTEETTSLSPLLG